MPLYEYQCENCGVTFEVIQKFSDKSVDTCQACGGKVRRLVSAPAIQFKGTGWYVTDYARKGRGGSESETTSSSNASSSTTSDKPATASDTKGTDASPSTAEKTPPAPKDS